MFQISNFKFLSSSENTCGIASQFIPTVPWCSLQPALAAKVVSLPKRTTKTQTWQVGKGKIHQDSSNNQDQSFEVCIDLKLIKSFRGLKETRWRKYWKRSHCTAQRTRNRVLSPSARLMSTPGSSPSPPNRLQRSKAIHQKHSLHSKGIIVIHCTRFWRFCHPFT